VALLPGGYLAVSNSNRAESDPIAPSVTPPSQGVQNVTVFNINNVAAPVLTQTVQTGLFPRNISVTPNGSTLFIPDYDSDTLQIAPITQSQ
jgi:6-phosphogluconolactonase (cycloisomerase 2 family)